MADDDDLDQRHDRDDDEQDRTDHIDGSDGGATAHAIDAPAMPGPPEVPGLTRDPWGYPILGTSGSDIPVSAQHEADAADVVALCPGAALSMRRTGEGTVR